ncbi:unnamed protein product [Pedinophyceae sp. YPF-701]|nr:unnamed protein product [Pedinophyceae sp. YPF-701]
MSGFPTGFEVQGGRDRTAAVPPKYEEQPMTFKSPEGHLLVGKLVDVGEEVCVLCHGFMDGKDEFHLPELAKRLANEGVSTLRFDFSGNGESEGTFQFGNYYQEAGEIRTAVEALQDRGMHVRALLGHSKGANAVLLYEAVFDDVPLVVNVAGRHLLSRGVVERLGQQTVDKINDEGSAVVKTKRKGEPFEYTITKKSLDERLGLNFGEMASRIRVSKCLTIHGSADQTIPVEDAYAFHRCIQKHTLLVIPGADHNFTSEREAEAMMSAAVNFVVHKR